MCEFTLSKEIREVIELKEVIRENWLLDVSGESDEMIYDFAMYSDDIYFV